MSSNYSKKIYKDLGGDEEPVDFDFFEDGSSEKTKYHQSSSGHSSSSSNSKKIRPGTTPPETQASTSFSPRSTDLESTRSCISSGTKPSTRPSSSCLSVRLPTASTFHNDVPSDENNDDENKEYSLNQINNSVTSKPDLGLGLDPKTENIKSTSLVLGGLGGLHHVKHERPKTSRPTTTMPSHGPRPNSGSQSRSGDQLSDSGSYSSSIASDSSYSTDSKPTSSESDSDDTDSGSVTDVSPLQSPKLPDNLKDFSTNYTKVQEKFKGSKKTKFSSFSRSRERHHSEGSTKKSKKESVRFKAEGLGINNRPTTNKLGALPGPGWKESEAQELSMLLKAVLEMDKTPKTLQMPGTQRSRPASAKSNYSTKSLPQKRMNMSFSNERVREIDRENQRLLQQIMNKSGVQLQNTGVKSKRPFPSQSGTTFSENQKARLSHSALRRQRENRRIEIENMKILSRIDSTKPTREITKEALLDDHYKLTHYGQVAKTPFRRTSAKSASGKPSMSEASSQQSLYSNGSSSTTGRKGKRVPTHTKKLELEPPPRQPRPAWDDHW